MNKIRSEFDVAVIGGGLAGLCCAIQSARAGAKTALIQNRPMLGGNASSEIRMHICGADHHGTRPNARETGILEEIFLEHKRRNPENVWSIFDAILWEKAAFQENLTLFLNTHITEVQAEQLIQADGYERRIKQVRGIQLTNETEYTFSAAVFVDATGDASIADLAGAEVMKSRETMGNTLMFKARDMGHPVPFIKPFWAYTFSEEAMRGRDHKEISSGYWWIELGGGEMDTIRDAEKIRDELLKSVYGVWDHIKNGRDHGAQNYELEWVGFLPGKRESRRILGDYQLTEEDCLLGARFPDTVAYGGWPIDVHTIEGFSNLQLPPNHTQLMEDVYAIPYRCYYSRNIENLMMAGRDISTTPGAFASSRVMATCAAGGQAVGQAAAMAVRYSMSPRQIGQTKIHELQQRLIREDVYLPGIAYDGVHDPLIRARITSSPAFSSAGVENVIGSYTRTVGKEGNFFQSAGKEGWIRFSLEKEEKIHELQILLDSNLSRQLTISLSEIQLRTEPAGTPPELIRNLCCTFLLKGKIVHIQKFEENYHRFVRIIPETPVTADEILIEFSGTYGTPTPKIFGVRAYRNA